VITKPDYSALKVIEFTYSASKEELLAVPEILPTTEPEIGQVKYTVAETDLPTYTVPPVSQAFVATLIGGGYYPSTGYLYVKICLNGVVVATFTGYIAATDYYTALGYIGDVNVGDVVEMKLQSSVTDSEFDYRAYQLLPTTISFFPDKFMIRLVNLDYETRPHLFLGTPSYHYKYALIYHYSGACAYAYPRSFEPWREHAKCKLFRLYYGDYYKRDSIICRRSTTYRPYYFATRMPKKVLLRYLTRRVI